MPPEPSSQGSPDDFAQRAGQKPPGLLRDIWGMLRQNKKWWLTPIVVVLLLVGVLLVLSATPLGPFLYPLF
jgi:uncharacterized protein involved in exopolysaccharide biosynthesis